MVPHLVSYAMPDATAVQTYNIAILSTLVCIHSTLHAQGMCSVELAFTDTLSYCTDNIYQAPNEDGSDATTCPLYDIPIPTTNSRRSHHVHPAPAQRRTLQNFTH